MAKKKQLIITCEHAANFVPAKYKDLISTRALNSHLGIDFGAKEFAKKLNRKFKAPLHLANASRLVADLNRSIDHPDLFSSAIKKLTAEEKGEILAQYYFPYRRAIEKQVRGLVSNNYSVVHLSVHSFTPVLHKKKRTADIGILFDPNRQKEISLAKDFRKSFIQLKSNYKLKFNYPYKGTADGLTTYLRKKFTAAAYCGIELEINQKYPLKSTAEWNRLQSALISAFAQIL